MSNPDRSSRPRRSSSVRRSHEAREGRAHTESPARSNPDEKATFRPRSSGYDTPSAGPSNAMSQEEHEQHWRHIDPSIQRTSHSTQGSGSLPGYDATRIPSYHTTASSGERAQELDAEAERISLERRRRIGVGRHPDEIERRLQRGNTGLDEQRMEAPRPRPRPPPDRVAATTPISREAAGHGPQTVLHPPPNPNAAASGSSGGSGGSRRRRAAEAAGSAVRSLRTSTSRLFRPRDRSNNDQE